GAPPSAECTLEIAEADFLDMTTGKSDPMKLFTAGKLKISGNVMASQKLGFLQKIDPKQAMEAVKKARASGAMPSASAGAPAGAPPPPPAGSFAAPHHRLPGNPAPTRDVALQTTLGLALERRTSAIPAPAVRPT